MNKKALLDYALFARKELETQIALSLNKLGIYKDKILKANVVGDYTIIEGNSDSYPKRVYNLRKMMISEYFEGEENFETVVEEFAYTWFNRLVAIRFMEVHDYFPHGFHVLTSRDGSYEPEILSNLPYVLSELNLEEDVIRSLREQNKLEELYRYVLVKQCSALSKIIPDIFDVREPYLELLLPNNLLSQDSVIRKIELIPEEDFMNDIEVVGWLYQFYNSVKKDEVFASKKTITKDTLPAVTQLFTPDWIVRYMADNSVGRLWLESYPNSSLKQSLKYYVEDAKQDEETQKKLDEIKYKNVNPEEIKIIEPCCGSGHILVYVFDLLLSMYLEQGYNKRDVPALILKNNLYGLDVDKRAAQLAKFSLVMKARSIDNRFFSEDRFVNPRVFEIKDSQLLIALNYKDAMKSLHFSEESIKLAEYLVNIFEYGKVIGSLLKVAPKDYTPLVDDIKRCKEVESPGIFEQDFYDKGLKRLRYLARVAKVLAHKYDVMITNPPYIGISVLEEPARNYAFKFFPDSKYDMFAMFMETEFVKNSGFMAMINMHAWMFLSSYERLRNNIIQKRNIVNMLHLGAHAFETIGGEVVQTTSFVLRKSFIHGFNSKYYRLVTYPSQDAKMNAFLNKNGENICSQESFLRIPGCPLAYWLSDALFKTYDNPLLGSLVSTKQGLKSSKDELFFKLWHEVSFKKIDYGPSNKKWIMLNKGSHNKWADFNLYVINWEEDGKEIKNYAKKLYNSVTRTITSIDYYYKPSISWSSISSVPAFRFVEKGFIFSSAGASMFCNDEKQKYKILALLNSNVLPLFTAFLNPSVNMCVTDMLKVPFIDPGSEVDSLVQENYLIQSKNIAEYEQSMDFRRHPLIKANSGPSLLSDRFAEWDLECNRNFDFIKKNEERLNKIFIDIYGLNGELNPEISDNCITFRKANLQREIKSLISYFVGCLMGRYSLERDGLAYAGGEFNRSQFADYVDDDGVLPIYQFVGINDGLTLSICKLVKRVYGDTYYRQNLDFIANALGRKTEEGAEETINRYLNDEFFKDHLKTYQNRPIYWMFNSGKVGAFKCLVYLHRYDKNTLAKINAKYFLPRTAMYKFERERLNDQLARADLVQKKRIENQLRQIEAAEDELQIYGQVLDHMANQFIDIDLDDGVKVNYVKFQGVSIVVNGATVKKDLLVPFGLEKTKK